MSTILHRLVLPMTDRGSLHQASTLAVDLSSNGSMLSLVYSCTLDETHIPRYLNLVTNCTCCRSMSSCRGSRDISTDLCQLIVSPETRPKSDSVFIMGPRDLATSLTKSSMSSA
ncbi:hypothetical protein GDO81_028582 [Engystomops pustulosus]|uniref:Uncharacterized protein n=1 Tax=Engystomops pustulosus TaxID=76066 RepID=A0AAV6YNQ4_ENGPU|nr:hypothetical protein GDO81_028582 [Engystomops pustulosus]